MSIWLEKQIEEYVLKSTDISSISTSNVNNMTVQINYTNLPVPHKYDGYNTNNGMLMTEISRPLANSSPLDTLTAIGGHYYGASGLVLIFEDGKYPTLADAQTALAGIKIAYQRATPELINLTEQGLVEGQLESFENGTVYNSSDTFHAQNVSFEVPTNRGAQIESLLDSANSQAKQISAKANKVQEDILVPTITGGYTATDVGYYKNDFSSVHLKGYLTGGTGSSFTLPIGYRPSVARVFKQADTSTGNPKVTIGTDGTVTPSGACYLDGINFRV